MCRRLHWWLLWLIPLLLLLAHEAAARAGGGGGYSGGGGSGGGNGGDVVALFYLVYLLFELLFWLWQSGPIGKVVVLLIVAAIIALLWRWWKRPLPGESGYLRDSGRIIGAAGSRVERSQALRSIRDKDPNFSRVMFLDFAHLIFVKLHESRGGMAAKGEATAIMPYLAEGLRERLKSDPAKVREVIVGALNIARVDATQNAARIVVHYKANLVIETKGGRQRHYLEQRLTFVRPTGVITPTPEKLLALGCPNCGSPEEPAVSGACPSCGSITGSGEMSWQVKTVETLAMRPVPEALPSGGGVEAGTTLPTIFAGDLNAAMRDLKARDSAFTLESFNNRVRHIFSEIQGGWSELDESRLRPYETNTLFDSHRYWLERYREEGRRNVVADLLIDRIQLCRLEHDAWFDAATVRIFASCKDYTVDTGGNVVSGSKTKTRKFSEYWTFIRRSDVEIGPSRKPENCPNCGAPLDKVNRAGVCEYCNGLIISGRFDWVAAIIEQDEEYEG